MSMASLGGVLQAHTLASVICASACACRGRPVWWRQHDFLVSRVFLCPPRRPPHFGKIQAPGRPARGQKAREMVF